MMLELSKTDHEVLVALLRRAINANLVLCDRAKADGSTALIQDYHRDAIRCHAWADRIAKEARS